MDANRFYIDGQWVEPAGTARTVDVINPATEETIGTVALGGADDVDRAVAAARRAFRSYSAVPVSERLELLGRIIEIYERRADEIAEVVTQEMGAPISISQGAQVPAGLGQLATTLDSLKNFNFTTDLGTTSVEYEPVGVCGFITPWNWPLLLMLSKISPALAMGCTMVLKPSEIAPFNAVLLTEILDEAGVPAGVFNLVHGDGPTVGASISAHPDIDMVSFTGSTAAGVDVAAKAAPSVKRVTQELGGKSANIILADADLGEALTRDVKGMCVNSGQSCNAGSRILVPAESAEDAVEIAQKAIAEIVVGDPTDPATEVGPVVSEAQWEKVQRLIKSAVDAGATVVAGGTGKPDGLSRGYFVRPTVLANVTNDMEIAQEEIFGPVMTLITYEDEDDAVEIANDSRYGLAGMVSSGDHDHARAVARRMRTGMVHLNGAPLTMDAPFGGFRQSGNGREYGTFGLLDFAEVKSIYGGADPSNS